MSEVLTIAAGTYGVHLVYTALVLGWTGLGVAARDTGRRRTTMADRAAQWMEQAGLGDVRPSALALAATTLDIVGTIVGFTVFGGAVAAVAVGLLAAATPLLAFRSRRATRLALAQEAWPQLIEEIRVLTGAAGRSIPTALFDAGGRGPLELRGAFADAHREWLLTTDFERTIDALKRRLASPVADAACETLLAAHLIGGADLDRRLAELAEDRRQDNQGRQDARAEQAGVRFARRFVLLVPFGMAVAGMSLGNGRAAYQRPTGQLLVALGLALVAVCWVWSGLVLRLPIDERVFA